ncbi:hypothetical protein EDD11_004633 [Mortierella claussenii]|nr:hypothetical protein EDD11_004633 [Mortierella claussenii]
MRQHSTERACESMFSERTLQPGFIIPSKTSTNLKTSAAAAICARLLVHPLDNVRASIQTYKGVPQGIVPQLKHLSNVVRRELQYQQKRHEQWQHSRLGGPQRTIHCERVSVYKGLYKGIAFSLVFQVPALALFLSTYDASKRTIAQVTQSANLSFFHLWDAETHLLSGMTAKAAGTVIWAPMNRIQNLANAASPPATGQVPLTLREAYRLGKKVCRSEGVVGLWSGYTTTYTTLLPYTMIYFATYEQIKQLARWIKSSKDEATVAEIQEARWTWQSASNGIGWGHCQKYWSASEQQRSAVAKMDLTLDMYMMCVASAVIVSSAICQTASAVRTAALGNLSNSSTLSSSPSSSSFSGATTFTSKRLMPHSGFIDIFCKQPLVSALSPSNSFPSALSVVASAAAGGSSSFRLGLPRQQSQHATLTTTGLSPLRHNIMSPHYQHINLKGLTTFNCKPSSLMSTMMMASSSLSPPSSFNDNDFKNNAISTSANSTHSSHSIKPTATTATQAPGLIRTIVRGLGPRIMWTVPGVTLTTAGFEFLRSMA